MSSRACILGCSGLALTDEERAFFREARPWGFILFGRNIDTPDQVLRLVEDLRACVDRPSAPVLIDQEGGRVQRLRPPHWPKYPPARMLGELPPDQGREIVRLGARLMAHDLLALGITVDCVPVLDVPAPGSHEVIGDRAYGETPDRVAILGRAACEGLMAGGVLPVIKHIPGHGRGLADSHHDLPVVDASVADLGARDFQPFRMLSDMPMAMTAHVLYPAIDPDFPATTSRKVIQSIIREGIGFDGLLMSDDLSMKALGGGFADRTRASLEAGCDLVLHCNGQMEEMTAVVSAAGDLDGASARRAQAALGRVARQVEPLDVGAARARFAEGLSEVWAA